VPRVEDDELARGTSRREALDGGERDRVVVASGKDEGGHVRVGLAGIAARVVEQPDVERNLAAVAVVVNGDRPLQRAAKPKAGAKRTRPRTWAGRRVAASAAR